MIVFTDGACKENARYNGIALGNGGWAYIALKEVPGQDMEVALTASGSQQGSTNQEMEIVAVASALEAIGVNSKIIKEEEVLIVIVYK